MDGVGLIFFFQLPITEYFLTVFPSSTEWMDGVGQFFFFQLQITEYFLILIFFSYQLRNIS